MKRKKQKPYNQESSTQDGSPSDLTEKSKFYRQTKDELEHQQNSFPTNVKWTFLGEKERPQLKTRKLLNGKAH